jgi:hypothetical protein
MQLTSVFHESDFNQVFLIIYKTIQSLAKNTKCCVNTVVMYTPPQ